MDNEMLYAIDEIIELGIMRDAWQQVADYVRAGLWIEAGEQQALADEAYRKLLESARKRGL